MSAPPARRTGTAIALLRLLGAALLLAIAGIHGYLWQQGFRDIDYIGPGFLLDTVLGVGGAILVLAATPRWLPLAAAAGALLAAGNLAALLVSTTVGLFGFVESTLAPLWWESLWVDLAGTVTLAALAVLARRRRR